MHSRLYHALTGLLEWIGEGRRLSELPKDKRGLYKFALRQGYVTESPIPGDRLINPARPPL